MRNIEKPSSHRITLLFKPDTEPAEQMLTLLGDLPLVAQALRSLGLPQGASA
jgi:hypothetical protein